MSAPEKPLVYLILGTAGSGRREVIADLIAGGFEATDRVAVMLPAGEAACAADEKLPGVTRWRWDDGMIVGPLPAEIPNVFFVTDGAGNLIDQLEVFKAWLEAQGGELARVFTVVNCQLAERHPPLPKIRVPTTVLQGRFDDTVSPRMVELQSIRAPPILPDASRPCALLR